MQLITTRAEQVLEQLYEGNRRFRTGESTPRSYVAGDLVEISKVQRPSVAIIACSDSRVCPEVIFDQPLGTIFSSRVPGNVASDSAKWMLEIAVSEFQVPLVMVMGHTGCLAVGQLLDGDRGGAGGLHRFAVLHAVYRAKSKNPNNLYRQSVEENAAQTVEHLVRDLQILRAAVLEGKTSVVGCVYEMETGEVQRLDITTDLYGKF
jgi:carbonic anhydrase